MDAIDFLNAPIWSRPMAVLHRLRKMIQDTSTLLCDSPVGYTAHSNAADLDAGYDNAISGEIDQLVADLYERAYYTKDADPEQICREISFADFTVAMTEDHSWFGDGPDMVLCPMRITAICRAGVEVVIATIPTHLVQCGLVEARFLLSGPSLEEARRFLTYAMLFS